MFQRNQSIKVKFIQDKKDKIPSPKTDPKTCPEIACTDPSTVNPMQDRKSLEVKEYK